MSGNKFPTHLCIVLILLTVELVLSVPQGYNYYSHQQRINAQRLQAQRVQAQNRYRTTRRPNVNRVSRADRENAKFLGSGNQEFEDTERTLHLIRKKKQLYNGVGVGNPCFARNAGQDQPEGRFLWDLNVYNVYPTKITGGNGCGGYGGGFFDGGNYGGGGFYGGRPFRRGIFQNLLNLFIPGGALNPNISPNRPYQSSVQSDSFGSNQQQNTQNEPLDYDLSLDGNDGGSSNSNSGPTNSGTANFNAPASPGDLVGGVASTVNNVIQQLSGNYRPPVYRGYG